MHMPTKLGTGHKPRAGRHEARGAPKGTRIEIVPHKATDISPSPAHVSRAQVHDGLPHHGNHAAGVSSANGPTEGAPAHNVKRRPCLVVSHDICGLVVSSFLVPSVRRRYSFFPVFFFTIILQVGVLAYIAAWTFNSNESRYA